LGDWEDALDTRDDTDEQIKGLADRITDEAVRQLTAWGSELSEDHLRGVREPCRLIAEMAYAVAIPEIALSSMSTGMGKSEIAAAAGRVLTSTPELATVGMLYAASTKRDLESMIERMGFNLGPDARYAVYTGKDNVELNALGLGYERRNEAQVLFTTQAKLLHLSRFRPNFAYNENFHYNGAPRKVRIWDESILPIDTLTLSPDQLELVAGWLFANGQDEHAQLTRDFAHELSGKAHDSIVKIPVLPPLKPIEEGDEAAPDFETDESELEALEQAWSILTALGGSETCPGGNGISGRVPRTAAAGRSGPPVPANRGYPVEAGSLTRFKFSKRG
jgi:hypothetical protein